MTHDPSAVRQLDARLYTLDEVTAVQRGYASNSDVPLEVMLLLGADHEEQVLLRLVEIPLEELPDFTIEEYAGTRHAAATLAYVRALGTAIRKGDPVPPIISIRNPDGGYWVPDGHHRLAGSRYAGCRSARSYLAELRSHTAG